MNELNSTVSRFKTHPITKQMVWRSFKKVKANKGSFGVDQVSLKAYEKDLSNNLYKLWNRMTSGSYFPHSVRESSIRKKDGGKRKLGIPTVEDRIAQMVVKDYLEPTLEAEFVESSYGYRPNRGAHDAVRACQQNCHEYSWVIDLDIQGFFDHMDHELLHKALSRHNREKWVHMYVSRWLKASVKTAEGVKERDLGTPQGGVISPLLSNLYLHYTLDKWLGIKYPSNPFERYADDMVIHCRTLQEAEQLLEAVRKRLSDCGLQAHSQKTKIVYCKNWQRREDYDKVSFDFLSYTFKPRQSCSKKGNLFLGFNPGVSNKAIQRMYGVVKTMTGQRKGVKTLEEMSKLLTPKVKGWISYYGKFRRSDMNRLWDLINNRLIIWVKRNYKRVKRSIRQARAWLSRIQRQNPFLFYHWYFKTP